MTVDEAKDFLSAACKLTLFEQQQMREEIIDAFSDFWGSNPTMREFSAYTSGLLLAPEMLWLMARERTH